MSDYSQPSRATSRNGEISEIKSPLLFMGAIVIIFIFLWVAFS